MDKRIALIVGATGTLGKAITNNLISKNIQLILVAKNADRLEKLYNDKVILEHGVEVAKELAHVLSGGNTTIDKTLSEDDLFKLELDAFMKLIEMKQTQDRIKHPLATGKPLVN